MKRFFKHEYMLIAFGVILFVVLSNLSGIFGVFKYVLGVLLPVIAGFLIAFILNVPMRGFENLITKIFSKAKHKPGPRLKRYISLLLTFTAIIGIVALGCSLVIPFIIQSLQNIYNTFINILPEIKSWLVDLGIDADFVDNAYDKIALWVTDNNNISEIIEKYAFTAIKTAIQFAVSTVSGIFTGAMIICISIYALLSKDKLAKQTKRICQTFLKEKTREKLYYAANLLNYKYYKYLSGQFIEACILGTLGFAVLTIFRVPNAFIIAFITAILAFVPYVGAFTAFVIGAILTLISAPEMLLTYILIYFIVQIVETQFICPHVVGNAVGLSPLWTLAAVFVGGNLFGLIGMILFIPLFSVGVTLLHEYVDKKIGPDIEGAPIPEGASVSDTDDTPSEPVAEDGDTSSETISEEQETAPEEAETKAENV